MIFSKEDKFKISSSKVQNNNKLDYIKQNSVDVCRLCNNSKVEESLKSSIIDQNISILKNNLIPIFNRKGSKYETKIDLFQSIEAENKIIQPCNCLIPTHTKCLLKLILFTQNLSCPSCNSIFRIKKEKKKNFLIKCFNLRFFFESFIYFLLILLFLVAILVCIYLKFDKKFIHVKFLLIIFIISLEIMSILKIFKILKKIKNSPISEKLIFLEKNTENEMNNDSEVAIPFKNLNTINNNYSNFMQNNQITKNVNKSLKFFSRFLKVNFRITLMEILEYKNERIIRNKINQEVRKSLLDKVEESNKEKLRIKVDVVTLENLNSNINPNTENPSFLNFLQNNNIATSSNGDSKIVNNKIKGNILEFVSENKNDAINTSLDHHKQEKLLINSHSNVLTVPAISLITPMSSGKTLNKGENNQKKLSVEQSIQQNIISHSAKNVRNNINPSEENEKTYITEIKLDDVDKLHVEYERSNLLEKEIVNNEIYDNHNMISNHNNNIQNINQSRKNSEYKIVINTPQNDNDPYQNQSANNKVKIQEKNSIAQVNTSEEESQVNLNKQMLQMKYANLSLKKIEELDSVLYYPDDDKANMTFKYPGGVPLIVSKKNTTIDSIKSFGFNSPKKNTISLSVINNFVEETSPAIQDSNKSHTFLKGFSDFIKISDGNVGNDNTSQNSNRYHIRNTLSQLSYKNDSNLKGSFMTNSKNMLDFGTSSSELDKEKFPTQILRNSEFAVNFDSPERRNTRHVTYNYHKNNHDYLKKFAIDKRNKLNIKLNNKKTNDSSNRKLSNSFVQNDNRNDYDINSFFIKSQDAKKKSSEVELETKTKIDV